MTRVRRRASGTAFAVQTGRAVRFKVGAKPGNRLQIPPRDPDQSRKAHRVQGPSGSFNARWRREPGGGDTDPPEADHLRGSAEKKADREQLNDERGVKPLPVSDRRDVRRAGKRFAGMGKGAASVFWPPKSEPGGSANDARGGNLASMLGKQGQKLSHQRDCGDEGSD
jgi:hypothetical protein